MDKFNVQNSYFAKKKDSQSADYPYDRDLSTFTDPDVSVTPSDLQLKPSQVERAIYF